LSLEPDVFGPFDKSGQVSLRGDVTADAESLGSLLEQRVSLLLGGLLGAVRGSGGPRLSFGGFRLQVIESALKPLFTLK